MRTIWKFPLAIVDMQSVSMPKGAEILAAQMQGNDLCLWALVDSDVPKTDRVIEVFGTGNPIYQNMGVERKYIGTAQMPNLPLVWHVFERLN